MVQKKALLLLLLVSNHLVFILVDQQCPNVCSTDVSYIPHAVLQYQALCHCPDEGKAGSPCSWVGHDGPYSFRVCLDNIPAGFPQETRTIFIKYLRSPVILERSFPNVSILQFLHIRQSNVSAIQPGAFRGLSLVQSLNLDDNRICSLESNTFHGLEKLKYLYLQKNAISSISQHAFQGLPLLHMMNLRQNRLSSVPTAALLQTKDELFVNLCANRIATISSQDMSPLSHRPSRLDLMIHDNKLNCDRNLTWLICNLPRLDWIYTRHNLKCASPTDLRGTFLATLRENVGQSDVSDPQESRFTGCTVMSTTTASVNMSSTQSQTIIPTEDYADLDVPHTKDMPIVDQTTAMDNSYVILLGKVNKGSSINWSHLFALISIFVAPLLLSASAAFISCIHSRPESPETSESQSIEPYAVVYADSAQMQERDKNSDQGTHQTEDNDTIQPYAVTYAGQNDALVHQPYATTCVDDPDQGDNSEIQPYAVTYADPPQAARSPTETGYTPLKHTTKQSAAQSLPTGAETEPKYDSSVASTTESKSPYGTDDSNEAPRVRGLVYGSEPSQHAREEEDEVSNVQDLYNRPGTQPPDECATSTTEEQSMDTGPPN
ncbi:hypothetical protein Bbelb_293190 [Branchiostoma belcheri]|nr:hypothetical protein Bbelb_293190 [Branchiostoma belcheri]